MSGGVDSGVTAALMVKAGFKTAGFHMRLWKEESIGEKASLETVQKTAQQLDIPFHLVDLRREFKKRVVDYFLKEYSLGRTPNPCLMCNRFIKFGELLAYVKKQGYDYLATGHYARLKKDGCFRLLAGKDKVKDQSYFLYHLTQKQLASAMFPVGNYTKEEVRTMAKKWQLSVVGRPESQEICFFSESDYRLFLKRHIKKKIVPGKVIDTEGNIIGKHKGLALYTIGQRHGFKIADKKRIGPLYVIKKNIKKNQLIVGFGKEAEKNRFWVENVNLVGGNENRRLRDKDGLRCKVKIRHQGELLDAKILGSNNTRRVEVILAEGERGVSPGQAAVFYRGEELIGGGIVVVDKNE